MAVFDASEQIGQLWALIQELSEQLNQNRSVSVSLHAQAGNIKVSLIHPPCQSWPRSRPIKEPGGALSDGLCSSEV